MTTPFPPNDEQNGYHDRDTPLPRPARQRQRSKADRGLPPDAELTRLAAEYLRVQQKSWPELLKVGLVPELPDAVLAAMVEDFKHRHRGGAVDPHSLRAFTKQGTKLAGSYNRYSSDNSSPKSIIDQMVNALEKAKQESRFVPWSYVFADYSVSGLNPSRRGYASYKELLQDKTHFIETTYVDDFTRASRDEVEWWKLAHLSRRLSKRMIGASDGFDLSSPNWDMTISIYALLSRMFIKGLREKVNRGMRGAVRRGTVVGKLPLGFTRCVRRDDNGNIVRDKDGVPEYVPCIDQATSDWRKLMVELFVERCWSIYKIVRHFNDHKVDGWGGWSAYGITSLLRSASAVGVFIWNRKRSEYDHEQQKLVVLPNPRSEWVVYHDSELALVPLKQWASARKRLSAMRRRSPSTGRSVSRNQRSATTLFSGTLVCGACGREITLLRSAGKYKVLGCVNGGTGSHGCTLSVSKSTRIVEKSLLGYIGDHLLTDEAVEELVKRANASLAVEAAKPRVNTAPLRTGIKQKEAAIKKHFERIEGRSKDSLVEGYEQRISVLQKEANQLRSRLREAEAHNEPPPAPLDVVRVRALLSDLRGLLAQETPAAAEALRTLTGPITIRQEVPRGSKRGAAWVATFKPDFIGWLRQRAKEKNCPEAVTLGYIGTAAGEAAQVSEVEVAGRPKYVAVAAEIRRRVDGGASLPVVAEALGLKYDLARHALRYAVLGERPKSKPTALPIKIRTGSFKYRTLAPEVVRLRDKERFSFLRIGKELGIHPATAKKAYAFGKECPAGISDSGVRKAAV